MLLIFFLLSRISLEISPSSDVCELLRASTCVLRHVANWARNVVLLRTRRFHMVTRFALRRFSENVGCWPFLWGWFLLVGSRAWDFVPFLNLIPWLERECRWSFFNGVKLRHIYIGSRVSDSLANSLAYRRLVIKLEAHNKCWTFNNFRRKIIVSGAWHCLCLCQRLSCWRAKRPDCIVECNWIKIRIVGSWRRNFFSCLSSFLLISFRRSNPPWWGFLKRYLTTSMVGSWPWHIGRWRNICFQF